MEERFEKTGYLNSDFRIFYLTGTEEKEIPGHYHDFHKILYFERGSVSYYIEGETYQLQPGDLVLVPAGEVHRPVIHGQIPYYRLVLYISPLFFEQYRSRGVDLARCFNSCKQRGTHVLRILNLKETPLYPPLRELMRADSHQPKSGQPAASQSESSLLTCHPVSEGAAALLYQTAVLVQILLLLGDLSEGSQIAFPSASGSNKQILQILSFINEHLYEELPIDRIAAACFLNRSYLMHLFKKEMGCTLYSYITEKRLFAARMLIQSGMSVTEACMQSGFPSYSSFYRAYCRKFGASPTQS
jgi:AraC-like DNA-binding protein/mannose-6-phosphate isomerase-like protein (cupin superfamily)